MAEAPVPAERARVVMEHGTLAPQDFDQLWRMAKAISTATIIPKAYQGKAEDTFVAIQQGAELGLAPLQALNSLAVINGRATLTGDALLALAQSSGELEAMKETWDESTKTAICTAKRKGYDPVTYTFSWADAERIKVWEHGKQVTLASRDTYQNYPRRMCTMRARGFTLRDAFADRIKGMKTSEEMEEVPPDEEKSFEAARQVMPDLEHKPAPGVSPPRDSSAESSGQDSGAAQETSQPEPEQKPEPEQEKPTTFQAIIERIGTLTCENFQAEQERLAGKEVLGAITDPNEKLAVVMAINRRRRELFPEKK